MFQPDILENNALAFVGLHPCHDAQGKALVLAIAKLSLRLTDSSSLAVLKPQRPIRLAASHRPSGSVYFPSDAAAHRPGTDIIMLGSAHPAAGAAADRCHVRVRVLAQDGLEQPLLEHSVVAFGARVFQQGTAGVTAGPATTLSAPLLLDYANARGGQCAHSSDHVESRNPVGIGTTSRPDTLIGTPAYRLETDVEPAGFGPIDAHWSPRREYFGQISEAYMRSRYPLAPSDFDPRFHHAAHPNLQSHVPLQGNELIEVSGVTPRGHCRFSLPSYEPRFDVTVDEHERRIATHLDMVLMDFERPERPVIELTWRAAIAVPRKRERLSKVLVTNAYNVSEALWGPQDDERHAHHATEAASGS